MPRSRRKACRPTARCGRPTPSCAKSSNACANAALSTLYGDLLQTELIVATASSVEQIQRQLGRLKTDRKAQAARARNRFARRWGTSED